MKRQFIILFSLVFLVFSCSEEDYPDGKNKSSDVPQASTVSKESLFIDKEALSINSDDAKNVALLFSSTISSDITKSSDLASMTVRTVTDSVSNKPVLYIVNYGNDRGYTIISATKKYNPILAYSDKGHFDLEKAEASRFYIDGYKSEILATESCKSDSLLKKYALEWAMFEKPEEEQSTKSSAGTEALIKEEIRKKEALGYKYIGKLSALSYYLSAEDYQKTKRDICTYTDPQYNCEEVSLFFIKGKGKEVGPLIKTTWHQNSPFNIGTPNGHAGCVPIAIAQIAYYHKYPAKYNWNAIPLYPSPYGDTSEIVRLMKDIRSYCKVKYKSDGTSSTYDKAFDALKTLGYKPEKGGVPDFINLRNEIEHYRPVYIRGGSSDGGHAWVCEGWKDADMNGVVSVIISDRFKSSLYEDYTVKVSVGGKTGHFFYMNFGWRGSDDGWYRANSAKAYTNEYEFLDDQKIIIIKK